MGQLHSSERKKMGQLLNVIVTVAFIMKCLLYALIGLWVGGICLLVLVPFEFGKELLMCIRYSLQAETWTEKCLLLCEPLTISNFPKTVELGKGYLDLMYCIVLCTYYGIKDAIVDILKNRGTVREVPGRNTQLQEGVPSSSGDVEDTSRMNPHSLRQQLSKVNSELSQEKDKNLCVVCLVNRRELVLKPCNHYCLCTDCRPTLRKCPVCTHVIRSTEKIFHV